MRWVRAFNEGHDNVEHMARPGRPSVSEEDVEAVSALLDTDRRLTVREVSPGDRIVSYDCVSYCKETPGNAKNCFSVSSLRFDRGAAMASI